MLQLALDVFCLALSVTLAFMVTCHMVESVTMEFWIFMPVMGRSSAERDIKPGEEKEKVKKKIYEKES